MITAKVHQKILERYGGTPCREITRRIETELDFLRENHYLEDLAELDTFIAACKAEGEPYCAIRLTSTSFILHVLDITACNPLKPHYYCPQCKKVEFIKAMDGFDLPEKVCGCGGMMQGDGHNIPVEQLMGFSKSKHPFVFHLSEPIYKKLPVYFSAFKEEAYREKPMGVGNRLCAFFLNDFIYFSNVKVDYSRKPQTYEINEMSKRYLHKAYGVSAAEHMCFSDILFDYGKRRGWRSDEDFAHVSFLFREDLLSTLLSSGVDINTANQAVSEAAIGNGLIDEILAVISAEEKHEVQKGRCMPIKSLAVEWMCYLGKIDLKEMNLVFEFCYPETEQHRVIADHIKFDYRSSIIRDLLNRLPSLSNRPVLSCKVKFISESTMEKEALSWRSEEMKKGDEEIVDDMIEIVKRYPAIYRYNGDICNDILWLKKNLRGIGIRYDTDMHGTLGHIIQNIEKAVNGGEGGMIHFFLPLGNHGMDDYAKLIALLISVEASLSALLFAYDNALAHYDCKQKCILICLKNIEAFARYEKCSPKYLAEVVFFRGYVHYLYAYNLDVNANDSVMQEEPVAKEMVTNQVAECFLRIYVDEVVQGGHFEYCDIRSWICERMGCGNKFLYAPATARLISTTEELNGLIDVSYHNLDEVLDLLGTIDCQ